MVDVVNKETRSRMMAGIRGKHTRPEMALRSALHKAGFRFRLHDRKLPGTPDIVLPRFRIAIEVHGCFWHRHPGCRFATTPATNRKFWVDKFRENVGRDRKNKALLEREGWTALVFWECDARDPMKVQQFVEALERKRRSLMRNERA